ncbi:MAG: murein L,D-transpeptidase catalytic domain family protein, partial [Alphaproteobacteria bacterium]
SNEANSRMSSLGAFVTAAPYLGAHGLSLKLIGLEKTNDRAEARAIDLHGAPYVSPDRKVLGRSWGCPAVELHYVKKLIERLKGGALLLAAR